MSTATNDGIVIFLSFVFGMVCGMLLIGATAQVVHDASAAICPSKQIVTRCVEVGQP